MTPKPPAARPGKKTVPPPAPAVEDRRWLPRDWTHSDTIALEGAHEAINNYTSLFSEEFVALLADPLKYANRIAAIQKNDQAAERDRDRLASFDRALIARINDKYTQLLEAARSASGSP